MSDAVAVDLAQALDPALFATNMGFAPDQWQGELLRTPAKQVILNCSRQAGKSTSTALLTLHTAMYEPGSLILLLSPSLRQSGELFKKVKEFWEGQITADAESETKLTMELKNGSRIISLPGKSGTIRGFSGVNLLIVDEAAFVPDDLYFAVRPMLAVSGGRIILLSTPFGKRGFFHDVWTAGQGWEKFEVPATKCPRISPEFLAEERRSMPEWRFNQEYLCSFEDSQTSAFSFDDVMAAVSGEEVQTWEL